MALGEPGNADGKASWTLPANEVNQTQGMREAFRVCRELGLPFRRIAPQRQDAGKARIIIFRNDISQFRPTVAHAGQVGDERKARLHELGAVFKDGRAVGATGAIGERRKVDAQRLQRPRGIQHRRSFLRLLRRKELHGNRRAIGGPQAGEERIS